MKKFFIALMFLLSSLAGISQTNVQYPTKTGGYGWQQVGETCAGCASFFVGIKRSTKPNDYGNYKYDVYFLTNSFNASGTPRMTYISGISYSYWNAYARGWTKIDAGGYWVLVGGQVFYSYTILSSSPALTIKISIGSYVYR